MKYLISYTKSERVVQLDIDRLKPSDIYIAKQRKKGVTVEYYVIEEKVPK